MNFLILFKETPFEVAYDPFRDWLEFEIKWNFTGPQWHKKTTKNEIAFDRFHLIDIFSSLLFDHGYYYDSFFKLQIEGKRTLTMNKYQFIHMSGSWLIQIEVQK